ncbi:MAG: hypothetical protein MJ078_00585 [Clostridia bacterium]|nr:hypothetical protein [Clostridia bacterium]
MLPLQTFFLSLFFASLFSLAAYRPVPLRVGLGESQKAFFPFRSLFPYFLLCLSLPLFLTSFSAVSQALLCGMLLTGLFHLWEAKKGESFPAYLALTASLAFLPALFGLAPRFLTCGKTWLPLSPFWGTVLSAIWFLLVTEALAGFAFSRVFTLAETFLAALGLSLVQSSPLPLCLSGSAAGFLPGSVFSPRPCDKTERLFLSYALALCGLREGLFSVALPFFFAVPLWERGKRLWLTARSAAEPRHKASFLLLLFSLLFCLLAVISLKASLSPLLFLPLVLAVTMLFLVK